MFRPGKMFLLAAAILVSGCQGMNKTAITPQLVPIKPAPDHSTVPATPSVNNTINLQMTTCLFEADQLLKVNRNKYREPVNMLYQRLRAAKRYAAISSGLNSQSTDTLTPMYQYRVHDACNTVSQLLLNALKQDAETSGSRKK